MINLSAAIPTVLSVVVYHEPMKPRKIGVLLLVVASLMLLWWDRKQDRDRNEHSNADRVALPLQEVE